ncbi:MAG: 2-hydroxyacyl-CoA dehydratase family protein [Desulfomonilaceae bacterium]|jgi:benzoyl-CoA reductase/2-hydroxyglutaryl-CoA dehydratase subunit BcrC/BadD/HgdB
MEPIKALKEIKKLTTDYFTAAHMAPHNNKPVVYCNVFTPVELIYAMDMFPVYPENHAAIIGARKMTTELSSAAEGMGYVIDLCSYARCDIGWTKAGISPTWGLPKPDLILVINCQCGTLTKWFEVLSRLYNAPMVLIDIPHSGNGEEDPAAEAYVKRQLEELIKTLETIAGKSLDQAKLKQVMALSRQASELWTRMLVMGENIPSPMTVFDQFISMFPIVSQRGTETAVQFYRNLVQELEERTASKIPAVPNEKFRLFWDNLPIWSELGKLSGFLADRGAAVVTSIYTWAWSQLAVNEQDPLSDWTRQYLYTFNLNLEYRIEKYIELAKLYSLDGFLFHSNRSCKWISQDVMALRDAITERTGIPGVIFEADQNDPRLYSFENLERHIDSFLELLASKR